MLIQCTSCGKQAKIPEKQEGAKVKCPACGHIYVARSRTGRGSTGTKKEDPTKYILIGGVLLGAAIIGILYAGGEDPVQAKKPEEVVEAPKEPAVDKMGWDSPAASFARSLHAAAASGNESKLKTKLDAEAAYAYELENPPPQPEAAGGAGEEGDGEAEPAAPAEPRPLWSQLTEIERIQYADELVGRVLARGGEGAIANWKPYDGSVVSLEDGRAVVHFKNQSIDKSLELGDQWSEWRLVNAGGSDGSDDLWKWYYADRWYTPEEIEAMNRGPRRARPEKATLSDGSVVYESTIRAIPFDESVEPAERERINKLVADLVGDIDARPKVRQGIQEELLQAGKNAVPALLTKMAEITETMAPTEDESLEDRIRLNFLHTALREITGYETTFQVSTAMGATQERIVSGLKQWFAWYDRKYKRFEERTEAIDPLLNDPSIQPSNDRERRAFEAARKAQRAKEKQDG